MLRFRPSLLITRRYSAMIVALLLAAQLSLFAHALGHDYLKDADQSHVVCGLCIAAHHLDNGLAPTRMELPRADVGLLGAWSPSLVDVQFAYAPFQARAPPLTLSL
jgi:hypothetical protein